jgi:hypothetical protein
MPESDFEATLAHFTRAVSISFSSGGLAAVLNGAPMQTFDRALVQSWDRRRLVKSRLPVSYLLTRIIGSYVMWSLRCALRDINAA